MSTLSLKRPESLLLGLDQESRARRLTKSAVVRAALERELEPTKSARAPPLLRQTVLLDTGPLVSFLAAGLEYHNWVVALWKRLKPPMLTCEAVLTEAAFLLKREGVDTDPLFALLEREVIRIALGIEDQAADLRTLMRRYRDRPMSLADTCLVRLSELHKEAVIFTLGDDFLIYRRHSNKVIPVLMPED